MSVTKLFTGLCMLSVLMMGARADVGIHLGAASANGQSGSYFALDGQGEKFGGGIGMFNGGNPDTEGILDRRGACHDRDTGQYTEKEKCYNRDVFIFGQVMTSPDTTRFGAGILVSSGVIGPYAVIQVKFLDIRFAPKFVSMGVRMSF